MGTAPEQFSFMHFLPLLSLGGVPQDSGPIYRETVADRFIVEPYNTFSNLIFLFIVWYWGRKVYKNHTAHLFLAWAIPVIAISYLGGTIYHAKRSHELWLLLDWVPIMLLCIALVVYFIVKAVPKWWQRSLFMSGALGISFLCAPLRYRKPFASVGYVITAVTVLPPVLLYLSKTKFLYFYRLAAAFSVFGIAIYFRSIDLAQTFFSMGTHWLWHFFGGLAVHCLIVYIFKDNLLTLSPNKAIRYD